MVPPPDVRGRDPSGEGGSPHPKGLTVCAPRQGVGALLGGSMKFTRLTIPTMVVAVVALVVAMSSGAVAAKLITGADVKDGSLTSSDIKNGTLTHNDIKKSSISADRIKENSLGSGRLKKGAVTTDRIKKLAVGRDRLADGAVTSAKILNG